MEKILFKFIVTLALMAGFVTSAQAIPVTINMTADNIVNNGGLCNDASCMGGSTWSVLNGGALANASNWQQSDSVVLDLDAGTHYFAWRVENSGPASSGNPAGLAAEILWDGGANYSSSAWEIFDVSNGLLLENATEYGLNGGNNIWTNVNGGAVAGISTNANWIYSSGNFSDAMPSAWIRTSISIASVPEPAVLGLFGMGLIGLVVARRRNAA